MARANGCSFDVEAGITPEKRKEVGGKIHSKHSTD
jgi:hypothetical protein